MTQTRAHALLSANDPPPCECINAESTTPIVLLCEHAGRAIPAQLGDLGVSKETLESHRGWDIGAEALARDVAARLDAPLVIQRYSRLVIDANRRPESAAAIPDVSDAVTIPANLNLSQAARRQRAREIFQPMDEQVSRLFETPRRAGFSIHSFTPQLLDGAPRPWHAGFLSRTAPATVAALQDAVQVQDPTLNVAINEPYQISDDTDWFIPVHCESRGIAHALIEIRNDQLRSVDGTSRWADLLAKAITQALDVTP